MTDESHDLIGAYALDALDAAEQAVPGRQFIAPFLLAGHDRGL